MFINYTVITLLCIGSLCSIVALKQAQSEDREQTRKDGDEDSMTGMAISLVWAALVAGARLPAPPPPRRRRRRRRSLVLLLLLLLLPSSSFSPFAPQSSLGLTEANQSTNCGASTLDLYDGLFLGEVIHTAKVV